MRKEIRRCYGAALAGLLAASSVSAEAQEKKGPPFAIAGFRYEHIPPRTHMNIRSPAMHMNICESPACAPGSKVSYVMAAPDPNPSFERYKATRAQVAALLKSRGVASTVDPPERTKDKSFTVFKSRRVDTLADGSKLFVLSQTVYSTRMAVDIISSSPSKKAAESNLALFTVPIMLLSQMKEKTGQEL